MVAKTTKTRFLATATWPGFRYPTSISPSSTRDPESAEAVWYGRLDDKHAAPGEHLVLAAAANLQPAVAVYLRTPGEPRYRPLALSVLRIEHRRVVEFLDLGRPEPFEVFGLPMSLAPSRRSNEDEVNPKEVR
jgi:hypothetical protein